MALTSNPINSKKASKLYFFIMKISLNKIQQIENSSIGINSLHVNSSIKTTFELK